LGIRSTGQNPKPLAPTSRT